MQNSAEARARLLQESSSVLFSLEEMEQLRGDKKKNRINIQMETVLYSRQKNGKQISK